MSKNKKEIELNVNGCNREYIRNIERLYKNGKTADLNYELEKILMTSDLQEGDSVMIKVEINKNGEES